MGRDIPRFGKTGDGFDLVSRSTDGRLSQWKDGRANSSYAQLVTPYDAVSPIFWGTLT